MKKLIAVLGLFCVIGTAYAGPVAVDALDAQIKELTRRRDDLKADIEKCKENTRKFKIAGISTLAATGVGVAGNIALHNKIESASGGGSGGRRGGGGALGKAPCEEYPPDSVLHDACAIEIECAKMNSIDELVTKYGQYGFCSPSTECLSDMDKRRDTCCCAKFGCPCL